MSMRALRCSKRNAHFMRSPTTTTNDSAGAAGAVAASDDGSVAESPDAVAAAADEAVSPPADDDDVDDAVDLDASWLVGMRCPLTCSARMCPWCAHSGSRPQAKGLLLLELPSPPLLLLPGGRIAR